MQNTKTFYKKGNLVALKQPRFEELDFVTRLWLDEETNRETGGPILFREETKKRWYEMMVDPGDGKNFYCLIYKQDGKPIGEVSFHHYSDLTREAEFNIKVAAKERGKGYGNEAIKLMLDYYFNEFGGEIMIDPVAINNKSGQTALLKVGFTHTLTTEEAFMLQITKETFNKK